jgi:hypothetical protein
MTLSIMGSIATLARVLRDFLIVLLFSCVIMRSVVRLSVVMLTAMAHCQEQTDTLAISPEY